MVHTPPSKKEEVVLSKLPKYTSQIFRGTSKELRSSEHLESVAPVVLVYDMTVFLNMVEDVWSYCGLC